MLNHELQLPASTNIQISRDLYDESPVIRYMNNCFFFMVQYRNNRAVKIAVGCELRNHIPILLYNMDFFHTPASEMIEALKKRSPVTYDLDDEDLSSNYEFSELGLRLWREDAFHPKLLKDAQYMKEMELVMDEMYRYQYFQLIAVQK